MVGEQQGRKEGNRQGLLKVGMGRALALATEY